MIDETRAALAIPKPVHTSEGVVPVRTLSATDFMMLAQQVVALARIVQKEARAMGGDNLAAIELVISKYPHAVTGLFCSSTGLTAEQLGALPLDQFFEIGIAFVEQNERSIERFFELRRKLEELRAKFLPSSTSLTGSSPAAGPTPTSNNSASINSKITEDELPSDLSTITSEG